MFAVPWQFQSAAPRLRSDTFPLISPLPVWLQYKELWGNEACTGCLPGFFSPIIGATDNGVCSGCAPGTYSTAVGAVQCVSCPANANSRAESTTARACKCNAGYTGADGAECSACVAGTYKYTAGSGGCMYCPRGKFSTVPGADHSVYCFDCPANSHSPAGSNQSCTCNAGYEKDLYTGGCSAIPSHQQQSVSYLTQVFSFLTNGNSVLLLDDYLSRDGDETLFWIMDVNGDGSVPFEEFQRCILVDHNWENDFNDDCFSDDRMMMFSYFMSLVSEETAEDYSILSVLKTDVMAAITKEGIDVGIALEQANVFMSIMDADSDGKVSLTEFDRGAKSAYLSSYGPPEFYSVSLGSTDFFRQNYWPYTNAFTKMDRDGDNRLTLQECFEAGFDFMICHVFSPMAERPQFGSGSGSGSAQVAGVTFDSISQVNQHHPVARALTALAEGCQPCSGTRSTCPNAEAVCEGHGYSESECLALGNSCCQWDPNTNPADLGWPAAPGTSTGACWSAIGDSPCPGGSSSGSGMDCSCDFLTADLCTSHGCTWGGWDHGEGCNSKFCEDMPGFFDKDGDGCDVWAENPSWCEGSPEDGVFDPPSEYANADGIDPSMACCVCRRSQFCEAPEAPVVDTDPCYENFVQGDQSPESCSDPFLGGIVGCCYDVMLGNCSTCYSDGDCTKAPFYCAQKYLDECGADASNTSVASESFLARAGSCAVSPTDPTAAYWNHPGYVLRGYYKTTTARSGIQSEDACAEVCGDLDECNAFIYINAQRLCIFLVGDVEEVCVEGSPDCVFTVEDIYGGTTERTPTDGPLWVYDNGGLYCAKNAMECGCTREYFQCLLQNSCEGEDAQISSFADMCSSRGCSSTQCGLYWPKSSAFASECTNDFFDCLVATDGDCVCTSNFVTCMSTDQDAVALDMRTGLTLIDMCTLEGCTSEDCGLEEEYCNATSLTCATEHMACSGGAYEYIGWDPQKTGLDNIGSPPVLNRASISFSPFAGNTPESVKI